MTFADAEGRGLLVTPSVKAGVASGVEAGVVTPRVVTARIVTPGDWAELDLDPSTQRKSILLAVRRAVGRSPGLAPDTVRLIRLLDDISRRAASSGGFYCASMVLDDAAGGFVVANVLMQIAGGSDERAGVASAAGAPAAGLAGTELAAAAGVPAPELCGGLAAAVSNDPDWAGADVTVVRLPFVGSAVRISVVAGGICLQYVVPLPSSSGELLVTFSCPCPGYVEPMTELFDAMAASLVLDCG
jgi:hypothetical protein